MRSRELVEAAAVFLALWVLAARLPDSLLFLFIDLSGGMETEPFMFWLNILRVAIYLGIALALIAGRKLLARWLSSEDSAPGGELRTLFAAALALLGVYFIISGAVLMTETLMVQRAEDFWARAVFIRGLSSLIAGSLLFLFCGGVARVWTLLIKLRTAGL